MSRWRPSLVVARQLGGEHRAVESPLGCSRFPDTMEKKLVVDHSSTKLVVDLSSTKPMVDLSYTDQ
jgi:hypothetical protein